MSSANVTRCCLRVQAPFATCIHNYTSANYRN